MAITGTIGDLPGPGAADARPGRAWTTARVGVRALAVLVAALVLCWSAVLNGQPFFHPDTVGYVRGADVALSKVLGPRYATDWANHAPDDVRRRAAARPSGATGPADDQQVMGGRSIYYGALVSLGERAGGFWLTVFIQSLAIAVLVESLLRALSLTRLSSYAAVMALLAFGAATPFFTAFLMPDIWAGAAIVAAAGLFALPRRLSRLDVGLLIATCAYAAMAHASVAPVVGGLLVAGPVCWLVARRKTPTPWLGMAGCVVALTACGLGGAAFKLAVVHATGKPPISPPFLTARVVADGPGTRFVREHCAGQPFVVCQFADRLPLDVDHFLWGVSPKDGVFLTASLPQRRALGAEQGRFALAVVRAYPLQQAAASLRNAALQTVDTELSDFGYKPSLRAGLASEMPAAPLARFRQTLAYREALPLQAFWALQSAVLAASLLALGWMALRPGSTARREDQAAALLFGGLVILGVLGNGVVCGVLSTLYGRYQARVAWAIPLAAALVFLVRRRSTAR